MPDPYKIPRWIARIGGLLFGGVFLFFLIWESIGSMLEGDNQPLGMDALMQLTITIIGVAGLFLAWRWELPGGIIASVSFVALGLINPQTMPFPLLAFLVPAVLFVIIGWFGSHHTSQRNAGGGA